MSTTGGEWQAIHGWAEPVEHAQTPRTSFGVRLLSAPDGGGAAQLEAPAGALAAGQRLSVRFFHDGAKRVLLEVVAVAPGPAGPQLVQARPLAASEPAPQRRSERTALSVSVPPRALECARLPAGERLQLEVVNASAGGVLVRSAL